MTKNVKWGTLCNFLTSIVLQNIETNEGDPLVQSKKLQKSRIVPKKSGAKVGPYVTASCYRSLNALTEVEEPAGMGESLGTGAHRHRSILPPGVKYVPGPRVLRRILSNRS